MNSDFELYKVEEIKESRYKEYPNYKRPVVVRYIYAHSYYVYIILILILISTFEYRRFIISFIETVFIEKGKFQWVALTAIMGLVSFVYSIYSTYKTNYYNTVSKARIEWIKEHRNNMAKLIRDCDVCLFKLRELVFLDGQVSKCRDEISLKEDELSAVNQEIQLTINKLLLQLGPNDDNEQLMDCIIDCGKWASSIVDVWEKVKNNNDFEILYNTSVQKNIMIVSQDYYKREWEKAKAGK